VLGKRGNRRGPAVKMAEFGKADFVALLGLLGITKTTSGVRSIETMLVEVLK
jgi:hypothetical protein